MSKQLILEKKEVTPELVKSRFTGEPDPDEAPKPTLLRYYEKHNQNLKEVAIRCKIDKNLTSHIARHTFATTIATENGVPLEVLSKMLGHTNTKTTQIYAKMH